MEKAADQVVCLTKGDAKEYKHTKKISIIPNFINTPHKLVENYDTKRVIAVGRLEYAKGFGGVRPQVLNKTEKKLMLGEASLSEGKGIIFNMTPSPGATSCLGNAQRDVKVICEYLNLEFDEAQFLADLTDPEIA